jgi:hypothetical protein
MSEPNEQAQAAEPEQATVETMADNQESAPETLSQSEANGPDIDNMSLEELDAYLENLGNEPEGEPQAQATEQLEEQSQEEAQEEEEPQPRIAERVRLTNLADSDKAIVTTAVQMVKDGLAGSIPEAIAKLAGQPASHTKEEPAEAEEQQDKPPSIADKLTELKAEIKKAREEFDSDLELELLEQLTDLKSDIKLQQYQDKLAQQQQEQEAQYSFESEYAESRDKANELYPDGMNPESEFAEALRAEIARKEKLNPAFFDDPTYPLELAGKVALKLGITPKTAAKAQAKPPVPTISQNGKTPRVAARPVNPMVGGDATSGTPAAQVARQVEALNSIDDLDAVAEALFSGR